MRYLMAETKVQKEFEGKRGMAQYTFVKYCPDCGAELYGTFMYMVKDHDYQTPKEYDKAAESQITAGADYKKASESINCPICGGALRKEPGYFLPDPYHWESSKKKRIKYYGTEDLHFFHKWKTDQDLIEQMFAHMTSVREEKEREQAKQQSVKFSKSKDFPVVVNASPANDIQNSPDELKKYIFNLIQLEHNIFSLGRQLPSLYYRRITNDRGVRLSGFEPACMMKAKLEKLQAAYQKAIEAISIAEAHQPQISVVYPTEPVAPILGKPGLFNKKKILEENEALTAKYQAELEAYQKEVQRCDEEKARLISEERAAVIEKAQTKADAAKAALDKAEHDIDDEIKALEVRPVPAKAVKEILDKEISETEVLLEKSIAARNELYAYDVVFGKYRNVVALSSFYEYLLSGRCSSLEGADGAYNTYESEIRANRVIAQLDTVISSLETIKQNQYMMYQEMKNTNYSLRNLNSTMDKALASIQCIEANTTSMNEYMEHISKNSNVIAHNTAVAAYYSKVNADLTKALGYMVAFK